VGTEVYFSLQERPPDPVLVVVDVVVDVLGVVLEVDIDDALEVVEVEPPEPAVVVSSEESEEQPLDTTAATKIAATPSKECVSVIRG
jgi:hypothetical protein